MVTVQMIRCDIQDRTDTRTECLNRLKLKTAHLCHDHRIFCCLKCRQQLYGRIDRRAREMFEAGLAAEVQALLDSGVPASATAMQAIGYKETARALGGEISMQQALEQVQQSSRRYAKRQLTWFRRNEEIRWLDASRPFEEVFSAARQGISFFDSGI